MHILFLEMKYFTYNARILLMDVTYGMVMYELWFVYYQHAAIMQVS